MLKSIKAKILECALNEHVWLVAPEFAEAIDRGDLSNVEFYRGLEFNRFIGNRRDRLCYRGFAKIKECPAPLERIEAFLKMGQGYDAKNALQAFIARGQGDLNRVYYVMETDDTISVAIGSRV